MKKIFKNLTPELQGGILIILAFVVIGPNDVLIPFISKESSLWQFHFSRSLIVISLILIWIFLSSKKVFIYSLRGVLIRSVLYTSSMLIYFGCLSFLPIAIVGAGMFTSPIFVLLISYFFYKEKIGLRRISAVVIGSIGVWIILDPLNEEFSFFNFLPIIGGFFLAMGNVTTWRLCSKESPLTLTLFFFSIIGFFGLLGIIAFSFFDVSSEDLNVPSFFIGGWSNGSFILWLLIIIQSIGSMIGIALLTKAYQMADTSYLNVFEYSFFIFAGFAGWIILGQLISNFELLGIVLIIIAGIIVSLAGKKK